MPAKWLLAFALLPSAILCAQSKPNRASAPMPPQTALVVPKRDDLAAARDASDRFLSGLKIAELPEGRQLMRENQWITGEADNGENFYTRPQFVETTPLFERLFDTDVAGVQGYKRLLEMKATSEAGTQLLIRYWLVAFKDRRAGEWKLLCTGQGDSADFDKEIAFWSQKDQPFTSEVERLLIYGRWLLLAGRISEARNALTSGLSASTKYPDPPGQSSDAYAGLHVLQLRTLLGVVDSISGDWAQQ